MAGELRWRGTTTGAHLYVTVSAVAGTMWNTYATAFETEVVAHWYSATVDNYAVALTETPASGYRYVGDWPTGLTVMGWYMVDVYLRAGATPAISDALLGQALGYWNGTAFLPQGSTLEQWMGSRPAALTTTGYVKSDTEEWALVTVSVLIDLIVDSGTAQAGGNTSITLASTAPSVDLYGGLVVLTSGPGAKQSRSIQSYNTGTKVATLVAAWGTNPTNASGYVVLAGAGVVSGSATAAQVTQIINDALNARPT